MKGREIRELGRPIDTEELMLVHIRLGQGEQVPPHTHHGQDVYFTPVLGALLVTLDSEEEHRLNPGAVLQFGGESTVAVKALEDSEFFVYLITRK